MITANDEYYMRVAMAQARRGLGLVAPNPSVGCVIVKNGVIIAAARTQDGGRPHAEAAALAQVEALVGAQAKGATVYVTLEPCAHQGHTGSCAEALIKAGVARVVVGCIDPNPLVYGAGIEKMRAAGIEVALAVLERECAALNRGFVLSITQNRPMVTLKLALSADNKIAARAGQRTQISGDLAGRYTHLLRSQYDAILVGVNTVLVDNPFLTCRLEGHLKPMIRVVLDGSAKISPECNMVQGAARDPVLVVHAAGAPVDKIGDLTAAGCGLIAVDPHDLGAVLNVLARRGITRLLVEGGAMVAASFLKAGLVDEIQAIGSQIVLGAGGVDAFCAGAPEDFGFKVRKTRPLGQDLLEIYGRAD